jgi:excisionase family DNA binding protein
MKVPGTTTELPSLSSRAEVAQYLAVSERTVRRLEGRGLLRTVRVGGRVLIRRDDLARFIEQGGTPR